MHPVFLDQVKRHERHFAVVFLAVESHDPDIGLEGAESESAFMTMLPAFYAFGSWGGSCQ